VYPIRLSSASRPVSRLAWLSVDAAVQFHNQTPLGAAEVYNILTHGVLAAKLEAVESESPQSAPRGLFRFGLLLAKVARPRNLHFATGEGAALAQRCVVSGLTALTPSPPGPSPPRGRGEE
jgi:hypothetical protein